MDLMFAGYASTLFICAAIVTWLTNPAHQNPSPELRWIGLVIVVPLLFIGFGFELLSYASKAHKEHVRKQIRTGKLNWKYAFCTGIVSCIIVFSFAFALVGLALTMDKILPRIGITGRAQEIIAFGFLGIAALVSFFGPLLGIGWLVSKTRALEQK